MPETYVNIKWPNGESDSVYSPSSVIENYFNKNQDIEIISFVNTCEEALNEASNRVYEKFGFVCTAAISEAQRIKNKSEQIKTKGNVTIVSIKKNI